MDRFLVPRAAGAPLFVAKRDFAAERRKAAHAFLITALGVNPNAKPNRRPTFAESERYAAFSDLVARYSSKAAPVEDEPLTVWWREQPEYQRFAAERSNAGDAATAVVPPAGAPRSAGAACIDLPAREELRQHHYRNDSVRLLYQSLAHVWAADGSHMGWRPVDDYCDEIARVLGHERPARSTAGDWLAREKAAFDARNLGYAPRQRALLAKPDVPRLLAELTAARSDAARLATGLNNSMFSPLWYDELRVHCDRILPAFNFSPHAVAVLAAKVFANKTGGEVWEPSETWCLAFMHKHMNLVPRRVTGSSVKLGQLERQNELHEINLFMVALALEDGLVPEYFIAADEFGECQGCADGTAKRHATRTHNTTPLALAAPCYSYSRRLAGMSAVWSLS